MSGSISGSVPQSALTSATGPVPSPDGTIFWTLTGGGNGGTIVDPSGNAWTNPTAGTIDQNGTSAASGVHALLLQAGVMWTTATNAATAWNAWNGSAFVANAAGPGAPNVINAQQSCNPMNAGGWYRDNGTYRGGLTQVAGASVPNVRDSDAVSKNAAAAIGGAPLGTS